MSTLPEQDVPSARRMLLSASLCESADVECHRNMIELRVVNNHKIALPVSMRVPSRFFQTTYPRDCRLSHRAKAKGGGDVRSVSAERSGPKG
jgi:hypothetical protein